MPLDAAEPDSGMPSGSAITAFADDLAQLRSRWTSITPWVQVQAT